jgi:hypothetical protein
LTGDKINMNTHGHSNGLLTLLEHYWFLGVAITAVFTSLILSFFSRLTGTPWIWCYAVALFVAGVGVTLIFYAKLPLYRQRRFFTFGSGALPESRRAFYRWGYRCAIFAVALLLCMLWSRP